MQTVYYTTSHFIRHTGNVVDLTEYRRRLAQASGPAVTYAQAPAPQTDAVRRPAPRPARRFSPGLLLDFCASAAIVVFTITVTIQFLVV